MREREGAPLADAARLVVQSADAEETRRFGERIGAALRAGDVVLLHGDLGAGKTSLAQGIARALGVAEPVGSPTFALVNEYQTVDDGRAIARFYHLDLYRLGDDAELDGIGVDEYFAPPDGVSAVEWPERAIGRLPPDYLLVTLSIEAGGRSIEVAAEPTGGGAGAAIRRLRESTS